MLQIFGTKNCKNTNKAIRYFKERKIAFQFIDLKQKGPSPGELKSISNSIILENLIDTESQVYNKMNLKYMQFDIEQKLLEIPLLLKTPIIRNKHKAIVGFDNNILKDWI